jgi:hypothetical protein
MMQSGLDQSQVLTVLKGHGVAARRCGAKCHYSNRSLTDYQSFSERLPPSVPIKVGLTDGGSERRCLIVKGGATLRGMRILHRSALLPLSEDGVTISHVLGAASYRPLAAEEAWEAGVTETRWV